METLSVFILSLMPRVTGLYEVQTLAWVALCVLLVARSWLKKVHWSLVLTMCWMLGSAIYCCMTTKSPYQVYGPFVSIALEFNTAKSAIIILAAALFLSSLESINSLLFGFILFAFVDCVRLFLGDGFRHNNGLMSYSIWDNQSMGASMAAVMLPLVSSQFQKKWIPYLLFVPAIIYAHSSVAWATLFIGLAAPFIARFEITKVIGLALTASVGGALVLRSKLLTNDGRFELWKEIFAFWSKAPTPGEQINHFLGSGTGSFMMYGPHINMINGNSKLYFIWAHSDWLQILFEQGYIGLGLALLTAGFALWHARRRMWLFSSCLTYAFVMLAQMPWRYVPSALYGAVLLIEALRKPPKEPWLYN